MQVSGALASSVASLSGCAALDLSLQLKGNACCKKLSCTLNYPVLCAPPAAERWAGSAELHSSGGAPMRLRGRAADALGALHRLRWPARVLAVWGALLLLARF